MQPHHWNEGESLLKELRSQKSQLVVVGDDGEDRIQDGFQILERMSQELKYQNHRNSSPPSLPSPQQLQQQRTLPQRKGGRHLLLFAARVLHLGGCTVGLARLQSGPVRFSELQQSSQQDDAIR